MVYSWKKYSNWDILKLFEYKDIMQNTWMIDQEGYFIYEWDILDFGWFDTAIIYYERWGFFAEMHTDKKTIISQPLYTFLLKHKNSIIVWNAFENEDLL